MNYREFPSFSGGTVSDRLAWYITGLVDGEGCFYIAAARCEFIIKLRDDDQSLLESVRATLGGIGTITANRARADQPNRMPQARWTVTKQRELVYLTEFFDAFPLKSKKRRDYDVWREAVIEWATGMPPAGLAAYKATLEDVRKYRTTVPA